MVCLCFITICGCERRKKNNSQRVADGANFIALKSNETNVRAGPGKNFPIVHIYKLRYMPLRVLGRYDGWLKIIDMDNDSGWISEGLSLKLKTIITIKSSQFLYRNSSQISYPTHRVEKNVVGKLLECGEQRCKVKIGKIKGWLNRSDIWGCGE
jgi:SH3-like domain-containing protein